MWQHNAHSLDLVLQCTYPRKQHMVDHNELFTNRISEISVIETNTSEVSVSGPVALSWVNELTLWPFCRLAFESNSSDVMSEVLETR